MKLEEFILKYYKEGRFLFFLTADFLLLNFTLLILKEIFHYRWNWAWELIPIGTITFFTLLGVYKTPWRFFSFRDLFRVFLSLLVISIFIVPFLGFDFSITFLGLSFLFISLLRGAKRFYREILKRIDGSDRVPTLIIGAGNTGEYLVRELLRGKSKYKPVAFVDEDKTKIGTKIHGVPVKGNFEDIPKVVKELDIKAGIIAIPSLNHLKVRRLFDILHESGIKEIKITPGVNKLPENPISVKDLKDLSIEDLLFREPVKVNEEGLKDFFKDKTILITGAGGSIGSEIVHQVLKYSPKRIIALEIDETELHNLLLKENSDILVPYLADIRDYPKLESLFKNEKIDIVFHAAAYKHVPMIELFPEEAVKTNIFGTYNLAKLSVEYGVEKFINISTDKAVNPTSIMGATKRFAEIICNSFNELGKTKFISVRFGNVLGSRGSVIPIFLEQIRKGGPITVTHPEMKRYFMTIPEAVSLVLQAGYMGKGGEVFVLDMGKPVKIVDLAKALIKLHGLEPEKDIKIVFTGIRPGEKLFEELLTAEEGTEKTEHERIFIAKKKEKFTLEEIENYLSSLEECLKLESPKTRKECIKAILKKIIPFYKKGT
jgi:FlaA1/EpsC-like NDP-sugar epimerase